MAARDDAYIQSLWRAYKEAGDQEARHKLILHYLPMARRIVGQLDVRPTGAAGLEDLASHAIVGLIAAVDSFDPRFGVRFATYATARIRGEVLDALRRMDWIPRAMRQQIGELRSAFSSLEARLGRTPTDEEVCQYTGFTRDEYHSVLQAETMSAIMSLDGCCGRGEESLRERDIPDPHAPDPESTTEAAERREALARALAELPERERLVMALYYDEELTFKEIGRILGVSEARVCQIHGRALMRLRTRLAPLVEVAA
ncbi:MAG: sigma-70 family RNA polymerase sigma factor [Armatimonadota bacterium]